MARAALVPLTDAQRDEAERHLRFCGYAANRFAARYRHVTRGEFLSAAFDGLVRAIRRYDEAWGLPLEYYAAPAIEGACVKLLRKGWNRPLVASIDAGAMTPGTLPDETFAACDEFEGLISGLGTLERFVFRKVYGPEDWDFRRVAEHVGLSPSRISQVHAAALWQVARRAGRRDLGGGRRVIVAAPPERIRRPKGGKPGHPGVFTEAVDPTAARTALAAALDVPPASLGDLLARLKPRQRRAVDLREGLDGTRRPMGEVAREMGMTRAGADYAHKVGIARLREMAGEYEHERPSRERKVAS